MNRALKLNPDFAVAHGGLGSVYSKQQEYEKALLAFNKALALAPNTFRALVAEGYVYLSLGEYDRAIADFSECHRSINPKFASPYVNRGRAYIATGICRQAITDFDEALKLEPKNVTLLLQRACASNVRASWRRRNRSSGSP